MVWKPYKVCEKCFKDYMHPWSLWPVFLIKMSTKRLARRMRWRSSYSKGWYCYTIPQVKRVLKNQRVQTKTSIKKTYINQQCCGYEIMSCVVIAIQNVLLKPGVEDIFLWYNSLRRAVVCRLYKISWAHFPSYPGEIIESSLRWRWPYAL